MIGEIIRLLAEVYDPLTLAGVCLVAGFLATRLAFRNNHVGQFLCQLVSFAGFTAMLIIAGVVPFKPTPPIDRIVTYVTVSVFKIVWWLASSWLLAGFVRAVLVFKRKPVETRLLQDLCAGFIYLGALLSIIAYVFDVPISGLLAASGVIAIVLGLALQSTLGDLFSGVVLNLAKPYRPGDWVILDGGPEGRVVETNWRATQILTPSNDLAIVPNSVIAKQKLVNVSMPTSAHGFKIAVRLDPTVIPSVAVSVLETAMLSCNQILRTPPPSVMIRSLDALALECELEFSVRLIDLQEAAQNELFDLVYRHCASARLRMAPPLGSTVVLPPRAARPDSDDVPRLLLDHLPIFAPLSDAERTTLSAKMKRKTYKSGDVLVEQGVVVQALFILSSGVLAALQPHGGAEGEVFRLAPGDSFCQASVLTGAATTFKVTALTRAVVYEIAKDDLAPILKERPAIADELGQILARWQAAGKARLNEFEESEPHGGNLADRVKLLFGLA